MSLEDFEVDLNIENAHFGDMTWSLVLKKKCHRERPWMTSEFRVGGQKWQNMVGRGVKDDPPKFDKVKTLWEARNNLPLI